MTAALSLTLRSAADTLTAVSDTPRLDAELLAAFALGISRGDMLLRMSDLVEPETFSALLQRRLKHEPIAYITGTRAFWDLKLMVTPDVLIPRADSETLIEAAQAMFAGHSAPDRILDLGTGSGALLLAALSVFPAAQGTGIDASAAALSVAHRNAQRLGFADRADMRHISWLDTNWQAALGGPFDLILCNPPYVEADANLAMQVHEYEPHGALFAGPGGMDDYRILIPALPDLLSARGVAIIEIGHKQASDVSNLACNSGLTSHLTHDLGGNPRCLTLRLV